MLRRSLLFTVASRARVPAGTVTVTTTASFLRSQRRFFLSATQAMRNNNNNSTSNNSGNTAQNESEDKAELERERLLREQFMNKIRMENPGILNTQAGAAGAGGVPPFNFAAGGPNAMPGPEQIAMAQKMFKFLFYTSALLFLLLLYPMLNPNSPIRSVQNIFSFELTIPSIACFLSVKLLLPRTEQSFIKEEFEKSSRGNIFLTFDQFFNTRYPTYFQGNKYSQQVLIVALSAVLAEQIYGSGASNKKRELRSIIQLVSRAYRRGNLKDSVDNVVDALRNKYPQIVQL